MADASLDVLGVGNAIVDVLAQADDAQLEQLGLAKGAMTLIDSDRAQELYGKMGAGTSVSGGSAANTLAGIAALGGKGAFMRGTVDTTCASADDCESATRQLAGKLVRRRAPVLRSHPGADHRHSVLIAPSQFAPHVEDDGRIIDLAQQWRIFIVLVGDNAAIEIADAFQLTGKIHGLLPADNGLGCLRANAVHLE